MVDDTQYVIVPNTTEILTGGADGQPSRTANDNGHYVAKLVKEGYRITHKASNKDSVHYVLIKFNPNSQPRTRYPRAGAVDDVVPTEPTEDPINIDDPIPF